MCVIFLNITLLNVELNKIHVYTVKEYICYDELVQFVLLMRFENNNLDLSKH